MIWTFSKFAVNIGIHTAFLIKLQTDVNIPLVSAMIVLPGTPFLPNPKRRLANLPPELTSARTQLVGISLESRHDFILYLNLLNNYLETIFQYVSTKDHQLISSIHFAETIIISDTVPWHGIDCPKLAFGKKLETISWTLMHEIVTVAAAMSLNHSCLSSKIIDDLVETEPENLKDTAEAWTPVIKQYKSAVSVANFGLECLSHATTLDIVTIDPNCFILLEKTANISTQISMLVKSSWLNRLEFNRAGSFSTKNNGTLSRVAIYALDELKFCQKLIGSFDNNCIVFRHENWLSYLYLMQSYATAYSVLFLSIDYYQQSKLGLALGLINYGLLSLQAKQVETPGKNKNIVTKFKTKFASHKNELYIKDLQSVTTLNIDKLLFKLSSGAFLKDLTFLFDQLIQLHLKLTKENDNLFFEDVVDWKDAKKDSKWPTGAAIPTSTVDTFRPQSLIGGKKYV